MNESIVSIDFYGDSILARRTGPGPRDVEVSLRRMCENIGVDFKNQHEKLKRAPWAAVVLSTMTGSDGKTYTMSMLSLRSVPMWLAGIDAERVAPHVKDKLVRYQLECADVLADHFAPKMETAVKVEIDGNDPRVQLAVINALTQRATEAEAALAIAAPKAEWVDRFVDSDGLYGLQNAGRALGVKPNLFILALRDADILTTQGRATIARSRFVDAGYFVHRAKSFYNTKTQRDEATQQAFITPKGLTWLGKAIASGKLVVGGRAA